MKFILLFSVFVGACIIIVKLMYDAYNTYLERGDLKRRILNLKNTDGKMGYQDDGFADIQGSLKGKFHEFEIWLVDFISNYARNANEHYRMRFEQVGWPPQKALVITILTNCAMLLFGNIVFIIALLFSKTMNNFPFSLLFVIFLLVNFIFWRLFDYIMDYLIRSRYRRIQKVLIFCVDLLAICTRAGLSIDKSFDKIGTEVAFYNADICREFLRISLELEMNPNRLDALRAFARRVDIPMAKILVGGLIHAEEQGVALGQTLSILSQEFSKIKIFEIETKAARLPVLLTIPLALFFLPVLFIIIFGPIVASVSFDTILGDKSSMVDNVGVNTR